MLYLSRKIFSLKSCTCFVMLFEEIFIRKFFATSRFSSCSVPIREISTLNHKSWNNPVKCRIFISKSTFPYIDNKEYFKVNWGLEGTSETWKLPNSPWHPFPMFNLFKAWKIRTSIRTRSEANVRNATATISSLLYTLQCWK